MRFDKKLDELQESYNEMQEKFKNSETHFKLIEEKNQVQLAQLQRVYEEKVAILLRKLEGVKEELKELKSQQQQKLQEEVLTPVQKPRKKPVPEIQLDPFFMEDEEDVDDDVFEDDENDPDWRKTPLAKQIIGEKRKLRLGSLNITDKSRVKRSSGGGCTCNSNCGKWRCGCKKMGNFCGSSCKCSINTCTNRDNGENSSYNSKESEEAFKKPR